MPCDYNNYPANWKQIRAAILERAGHKCEWCGVTNYALILRNANGYDYLIYDFDEITHYTTDGEPVRPSEFPGGYEDSRYIKVVLTIAHIDNPDPMDCRPENLAALCQRCHNRHDAPARALKAAATRQRQRDDATRQHDATIGQLRMFE